jgi:UrcA family protein
MSRFLIGLCITAVIAGVPGTRPARAADITGDPLSQAVQIYGGELSSHTGIVRVHDRLEGAARNVCRTLDEKDLERQMRYRRCVVESLERAVRDVHDARLSAYHQAKTAALGTLAMVDESRAVAR